MDNYQEFLHDPKLCQKGFIASWSILLTITFLGLAATLAFIPSYGDGHDAWFNYIIYENGLLENIQAISLISASAILGFGLLQKPLCDSPRKYIVLPLLAAGLFFMAAGEESSWGLEGFAPHPSFKNEHNLHHYVRDNSLTYIFLDLLLVMYALIGPLCAALFKPVEYIVDKYNIPLPPAAFTPFFVLAVLMVEPWTLEYIFAITKLPEHWNASAEVIESIYDLIILGAAIYQYRKWKFRKLLENTNEDPKIPFES